MNKNSPKGVQMKSNIVWVVITSDGKLLTADLGRAVFKTKRRATLFTKQLRKQGISRGFVSVIKAEVQG
jgi:hypothetical protein